MSRHRSRLAVYGVAVLLSGCSIYAVAVQPDARELLAVKSGATRASIIALLGVPAKTDHHGDTITDVYEYEQAPQRRVLRGVLYGLADVVTLTAAEAILSPLDEGTRRKTQCTCLVTYNAQGLATAVQFGIRSGVRRCGPLTPEELEAERQEAERQAEVDRALGP